MYKYKYKNPPAHNMLEGFVPNKNRMYRAMRRDYKTNLDFFVTLSVL